jgi:hypothetical protein
MAVKYYYAYGMFHPWWAVYDHENSTEAVAVNAEADTDMGNLYGDEFANYFPQAFEVSKEEYETMTLRPPSG